MTERDDRAARASTAQPAPGSWPGVLADREKFGKLRHVFTGVWLLYLISPVSDLFSGHRSLLWIAGGLVIVVTFCVTYVWTITNFLNSSSRYVKLGLPVIIALALVANLIYGTNWVPMWIYVSAATGYIVTGRARAVRAVLAVTATFVVMSLVTHTTVDTFISLVLPVALIGVAMSGFRVQIQLMHELTLAKETVAKLAVSEERLRLARDMHDLTGQSLSMITLKSELVSKLLARLPQTKDRDAAISEASDISRVSRQTLHDIREAVSGYRRPTLAVEIITARTALEAAGIELGDDPALTVQSGTFDSEAEAALAWCLREAVTNVIRHSGARTCSVCLIQRPGELSLEVSDDGQGLQGLPAASPMPASAASVSPGAPAGSGLRGMSERLTAIGGRLSFGHAKTGRGGGRGLRLVATVPGLPEPQPSGPPLAERPESEPAAPVTQLERGDSATVK
ncbi:MAG TPA: sensor histidine kinase [Streptosporangiaceae bacterium]